MDETSKTKKIWENRHFEYLKGEEIDIGCGRDPIFPDVMPFDMEQGNANEITKYVKETFDFVFSSHCLEHMVDPEKALYEWWQLVNPGGYLFFIVPDEDLYERGVWPSLYGGGHNTTFTISKAKSWSPVSYNVMDLVKGLPNAELIEVVLHDHNYNRKKTTIWKEFFYTQIGNVSFLPFAIYFKKKIY